MPFCMVRPYHNRIIFVIISISQNVVSVFEVTLIHYTLSSLCVCVLVVRCCSLGYRGRCSVCVFIEMVIGYILKEQGKDMTLSIP